jgi:hypothetical protein
MPKQDNLVIPEYITYTELAESAVYVYYITIPTFFVVEAYTSWFFAIPASIFVTVPLITNLDNIYAMNQYIVNEFMSNDDSSANTSPNAPINNDDSNFLVKIYNHLISDYQE